MTDLALPGAAPAGAVVTATSPFQHFARWKDGDLGTVSVTDPAFLPPRNDGEIWVPVSDASAVTVTRCASGGFAETPRLLPIEVVRARRWEAAKAYRASRVARGCKTPLGRVQTDAASRDAITQAAADATNNKVTVPAWSIAWVMEDNTTAAHNAIQMIAMAQAVRVFTAGCQAASQAIRKALDAAATAAAIGAVDITVGYPS